MTYFNGESPIAAKVGSVEQSMPFRWFAALELMKSAMTYRMNPDLAKQCVRMADDLIDSLTASLCTEVLAKEERRY